jgi:hypothetical protein
MTISSILSTSTNDSMLENPLYIKEGWARIDESAHITGIALIPRISRNENLYTKAELKRFNNVKVPLNWEHDSSKVIGHVTFYYNENTEQVYYEGMIEDDASANLARNKTLFTSIEANPVDVKSVCNGPNDCFSMPFGLTPTALALTETPGVPETSVNVIESMIKECFHDHELEDKYAPNQTNLKNEQHIEDLLHDSHMLANETGNPSADDQCVQTWISRLADEDPSRSQAQNIAIAFSKCGERESMAYLTAQVFKLREALLCPDCGQLK